MFQINDNYQKLPGSYLFRKSAAKVAIFHEIPYNKCFKLFAIRFICIIFRPIRLKKHPKDV